MFGRYVLMKKSTVCLVGLAAAGLVGYHFYKHHRSEIRHGAQQLAEDVEETVKNGASKAKEFAKEAKEA